MGAALFCSICPFNGGVAQLGERSVRNAEVAGSIPTASIQKKSPFTFW